MSDTQPTSLTFEAFQAAKATQSLGEIVGADGIIVQFPFTRIQIERAGDNTFKVHEAPRSEVEKARAPRETLNATGDLLGAVICKAAGVSMERCRISPNGDETRQISIPWQQHIAENMNQLNESQVVEALSATAAILVNTPEYAARMTRWNEMSMTERARVHAQWASEKPYEGI